MDETQQNGASSSRRRLAPIPLRATQVLGLCFYWAWVYLSFNSTSSINLNLAIDTKLLWVHVASSSVGVLVYLLATAFSRAALRLFFERRILLVAGIVMAAGTACYALPLSLPFPLVILGAIVTGISSPVVLVNWGALFSGFSARAIVLSTAGAFFVANGMYFASLFLSPWSMCLLETVLPLCATLLIPDRELMDRYLGDRFHTFEQGDEQVLPVPASLSMQGANGGIRADGVVGISGVDGAGVDSANGGAADAGHATGMGGRANWSGTKRMLVLPRALPWRVALGLFVIMLVYGGVRVYVGVADAQPSEGLFLTALLTGVSIVCFCIWGAFFQGENASLGTIYKIMLPLLACALLMLALFGQEYATLTAALVTTCNIVIELLSWILLADMARTTRMPAIVVFAVGRGAVQAGMMIGQIIGWFMIDSIIPFAIVSVFALMLVMGFMFDAQDTLLVFEAPTAAERNEVEQLTGQSLDSRLQEVAQTCGLTARETEIFMLWATGHGSKYIQDSLVISASTVKTHVRHIYDKCGVHNRAEIIDLLENGNA